MIGFKKNINKMRESILILDGISLLALLAVSSAGNLSDKYNKLETNYLEKSKNYGTVHI